MISEVEKQGAVAGFLAHLRDGGSRNLSSELAQLANTVEHDPKIFETLLPRLHEVFPHHTETDLRRIWDTGDWQVAWKSAPPERTPTKAEQKRLTLNQFRVFVHNHLLGTIPFCYDVPTETLRWWNGHS